MYAFGLNTCPAGYFYIFCIQNNLHQTVRQDLVSLKVLSDIVLFHTKEHNYII